MTTDSSPTFSDLLRRYRVAAGLSQAALAERTGLSERGISDLERGKHRAPHPHTLGRLADALGLGAAERARLEAAIPRPSKPAPVPPTPALYPTGNLPLVATNCIGREAEIAEITHRLSTTRLLTLTGAGGVGKTRLALEVARTVQADEPDGVWLVELATLTDPLLVPQAVAGVLAVRERPDQPLTITLAAALASKRLLLVLDNCEHLLAACATLAEALLRTCPAVRLLATSRERLGIAGEIVWRVPALALPEPAPLPSVDHLAQVAAVRLFVERASAIQPRFSLAPQTAAAVAQVCRRLDGIPLAIELAAARTAVLTVEQIAARLDDRFRLLTGGSRTAPPHQQTLQATIDWSHNLLTEPERVLFRRLAVFVGGFCLEAAEAVCASLDDPILSPPVAVLEVLAGLVDKSLVQVEADGDGDHRYRLLETLRHYAWERLTASGEVEPMRARHAHYFLALAERLEALRWEQEARWFARLVHDYDNLRAVLGRAAERGDSEMGIRLSGTIYLFWIMRGYLSEGRAWLTGALAGEAGRGRDEARPVRLARARALHGAGVLAREQGDYAAAQGSFAESLAIRREEGDRWGTALALQNLGRVVSAQGDMATAHCLFEESLAIFRELGDQRGMGWVLGNLGQLAWWEGDARAARSLLEESLALARENGDVGPLSDLGRVLCSLGDPAAARALLLESAIQLRAMGSQGLIAWQMLDDLACLAAAEGQPERALRLSGAAEALRKQTGMRLPPAERAQLDRLLAPARQSLSEAAQAAAWAEGQALMLEQAVAEALAVEVSAASSPMLPPSPPAAPASPLSPREQEVAVLVARGLSNLQIGAALAISERTAEGHVRSILNKLSCTGRAQIAVWVAEQGWLAAQRD